MKTLKQKIDLILNSKTPFDHIHKIFTKDINKYKCSKGNCKNKANYLTYSSYFKIRPIIEFMCNQCLHDAEHPGHDGSSIDAVALKDIPKEQLKRIYGVLYMSSIFIMLQHKKLYRDLEKSSQKLIFGHLAEDDYFQNRIKEHEKTYETMQTLLEYEKGD